MHKVRCYKNVGGRGEHVDYEGKKYFYRVDRVIPKDKVVALRWESDFLGRKHGDVMHIIVVWNGINFTILEEIIDGVREAQKKYKELSIKQAIKLAEDQEKKIKNKWDKLPKCIECQNPVIVLIKDQPEDLCISCFEEK